MVVGPKLLSNNNKPSLSKVFHCLDLFTPAEARVDRPGPNFLNGQSTTGNCVPHSIIPFPRVLESWL